MELDNFTRNAAWRRIALTVALFLVISGAAPAEQLPIKTYTTAEGLARNRVNRIILDSRGFLWFCTAEGLSRFDGYKFVNYTTDQGLPHGLVNDLLETRAGVYWVATGNGVCRFNPGATSDDKGSRTASDSTTDSGARFTAYRLAGDTDAQFVNVLFEDHSGTIWCGTQGGLFRLEQAGD